MMQTFLTDGSLNYSAYSNAYYDELYYRAAATLDPVARKAMLEELFVIVIDDAPVIPISLYGAYSYWWAWVRNYYGETAYNWCNPPIDLAWLDQAMKADMGY